MREERVAVVGIGYVGLPVACMFAAQGFQTVGIDVDQARVDTVADGRCPIGGEEPDLAELLSDVVSSGTLTASTDLSEVAGRDLVVVCVDTPLDEDRVPRLGNLRSAVSAIGGSMTEGTLVSVESTVPPGTMDRVVRPLLESESGMVAGRDFMMAHCPERVMVGRLLRNLAEYDRVLGGLDERSVSRALGFYSTFIEGRIHVADLVSAELAKTGENAYRDVQIAFANEMALVCEELGADVFRVRDLINSCPFRDMHIPGAGVGGHCLPKDPWLLLHNAPGVGRLIPAAREVNDSMPSHLARMVERAVDGVESPRVTVMGLAFLRDSDDVRMSPSLDLVRELGHLGPLVHDPYVGSYDGVRLTDDLEGAISGSDCLVFVTDHSAYRDLSLDLVADLMRRPSIVDGRNIFDAAGCESLGIRYSGIGKGVTRDAR